MVIISLPLLQQQQRQQQLIMMICCLTLLPQLQLARHNHRPDATAVNSPRWPSTWPAKEASKQWDHTMRNGKEREATWTQTTQLWLCINTLSAQAHTYTHRKRSTGVNEEEKSLLLICRRRCLMDHDKKDGGYSTWILGKAKKDRWENEGAGELFFIHSIEWE